MAYNGRRGVVVASTWQSAGIMSRSYQVFVERTRDAGPGAADRLAAAMEARYGIPATSLAPRLVAGRLRVKQGVDLETARRFAQDLESLGAISMVVDDAGTVVTASPVPTASPPAAAPRAAVSPVGVVPPRSAPLSDFRTMQTPLPGGYASGLAAAFETSGSQNLGVLGTDSGSFKLATLDGDEGDTAAAPATSFAPPAAATTGGGAAARVAAAAAANAFAPPDAEEEEHELELVADARPTRSAKHALEPSATHSASRKVEPAPAARSSSRLATPLPTEPLVPVDAEDLSAFAVLESAPPSAAAPAKPPRPNPLVVIRRLIVGNDRVRFAVGVVLAVMLAFIPVHLVASVREDSAFAEIDAAVRTEAAKVRTAEDWDGLDEYRGGQLTLKATRRRNIAISSLLMWAAVSGALGYVWFRRIRWA